MYIGSIHGYLRTLAPYMGISGSVMVPYKVIFALCKNGDCSVPIWKERKG